VNRVSNQIVCIHEDKARVAAVIHWGEWLPIQTDPELSKFLPLPGRRVMQVTHLKGESHVGLLYRLWGEVLRWAEHLKATDLICAVPPPRVPLYERLGFEIVTRGTWSLARNTDGRRLPVVVIRLRLDAPVNRPLAGRPAEVFRARAEQAPA
jgi:hypothetical protein